MSDHPRRQPRPPEHQPPAPGTSPAADPHGRTPHGVPDGATDDIPKGRPTSDRHASETVPVNPKPGS